jgi:hypothetical protein
MVDMLWLSIVMLLAQLVIPVRVGVIWFLVV